jgi:hypothetical protein
VERPKLPGPVETEVLVTSRRRCCICFGLHGDIARKSRGQIAHLDGNPTNNKPDNLAFLCLEHHDEYDSRARQSKGLTRAEVTHYREELCARIRRDGIAILEPNTARSPSNEWSSLHEEALAFHASSHRSQSVVLAVAEAPRTFEEINASIPPSDLDWTRTIVAGAVQHGWVECVDGATERYVITPRARAMLAVLKEVPEETKRAAWREVWDPTPPRESRAG